MVHIEFFCIVAGILLLRVYLVMDPFLALRLKHPVGKVYSTKYLRL